MADWKVAGVKQERPPLRREPALWCLLIWNLLLGIAYGCLAIKMEEMKEEDAARTEDARPHLVCESLSVVDSAGVELIRLGGDTEEGGTLALNSSGGEPRALLVGSREGGRLLTYRAGQTPATLLGVVEPGGPGLRLFAPDGWVQGTFHAGTEGPVLSLHDRNVARAKLDLAGDIPALELQDGNGTPRLGLTLAPDGPVLSLMDPAGEPRTAFMLGPLGPALFTLADDDIDEMIIAPRRSDAGSRPQFTPEEDPAPGSENPGSPVGWSGSRSGVQVTWDPEVPESK